MKISKIQSLEKQIDQLVVERRVWEARKHRRIRGSDKHNSILKRLHNIDEKLGYFRHCLKVLREKDLQSYIKGLV